MANPELDHDPVNGCDNGNPDVLHLASGTKNDAEMLEQIKQLLSENNKLKESMKQKNQEMKERLEELLKREKQREEQGLFDKQRLVDLSNENDLLKKEIQNLKETLGCAASDIANENSQQLKTQVSRLQAEKADLLGIISELQLKLSSCSSEDSFVEIRIAEKETVLGPKEDQTNTSDENDDIISYRNRSTDVEKSGLESEELAVSKLLHSLREETQKVEKLEKELQSVSDRMEKLEKKAADTSCKETQTETEMEQDKEDIEIEVNELSSEVDTLKQKVKLLNNELNDTNDKLTEAEQFKNNLQDKCLNLDKRILENEIDLEEKQKLLYSVQKLELQIESMQSEIKMEQSKTLDEKTRVSLLQEAYDKLKFDHEELRRRESEKVCKVQFNDLVQKLDACEKALAKKQLQIDEMNIRVAKQKDDLETIDLLRAQLDVYSSDFHAEREARQNIHQEKEQLAAQVAYLMQQNSNLKEEIKGRHSIEQLQKRHGSLGESSFLVGRGAESMEQQSIPVHMCPKCNLTVPDMDTLQIHVMDCIT
ncbi:optineurin [Spea bombifrons]|uniref:optineurin n=1 Tax=Spea bombifrons TaxID=233779 RepID=UPI00234B4230|nr:optineurin [Spea bombifrons]XP_053319244.1 optineurin [Spea bombifrons]XP_053319245.1 optineurin [Spea bombifrons]XP_053319246.1 optineurin [Spea bombifrons]XP_053319247.1 optineurin [Spea bombifrons]XP_053319248.1 optineurin [Spea bombifrons]